MSMLKEQDELLRERKNILHNPMPWLNPFTKIRLDKINLRLKEIELEKHFSSWASYHISVIAGERIEAGDLVTLVGEDGIFTAYKAFRRPDTCRILEEDAWS